MQTNTLELEVYYGTMAPWSNTTLLFSGDRALLIDAQFTKTDAKALVKRLQDAGKTLTHIILTHSHPDHVWGGVELLKAFPEAQAYARPVAITEMELEFKARLLRWTGIFDAELPTELYPVEPFEGDVFDFEGHKIELIDSLPSETINLMTCYIPELKTYIASDQCYNRCHYYVGPGLNRPDLWIASIEDIQSRFEIDRVVPGHGAVGGLEIFDEAIEYLTFYHSVAKPLVPQQEIVHAVLEQYPDWKLEGVLRMTIGPAVTSKALIEEKNTKQGFGSESIVKGYYRACEDGARA
ncbi:MBL fold metallo-hydrolase [Shewanella sedimentimangrovi]|uniref:MBL fold metallo-hydrolase n=1 Tax=Shewanella sedimentimangrovi TaxID=2814293 RepID=A0ABX7QZQ4_9GAMM|nr:MBL fold metallo-hydrolase [Shewanella sedimentimangrovi]QSX37022.1 MBL fold metallo-hydrolase [Shewanella sedimentimangrovi]